MATDSLFILYLLTPVELQSISRDLAQERETEDKSSGERAQGQSGAERFIWAAWWFVATHKETNADGKIEESPP